jgi:hypothetical protein
LFGSVRIKKGKIEKNANPSNKIQFPKTRAILSQNPNPSKTVTPMNQGIKNLSVFMNWISISGVFHPEIMLWHALAVDSVVIDVFAHDST